MDGTERDSSFLARAIEVAEQNVADAGGPFGAVIVGPDGAEVARGGNRVTATPDPTAHAEVTAIREACRRIGHFSLAGCTLYASCEPCMMCLAASLWSRLDRVVYAADRHAAHRAGFDDRVFYELFEVNGEADWPLVLQPVDHPRSEAPFDAWRALGQRVDY